MELSRRGFLGSLASAAAASTSYFVFGSGLWRPLTDPSHWDSQIVDDLWSSKIDVAKIDVVTNISPSHLWYLTGEKLDVDSLTRILEDKHGNEFAQQLQQVPAEPLPEGEFSQLGYRIGEGNGGPRKVWAEYDRSFERRRQLPLIS